MRKHWQMRQLDDHTFWSFTLRDDLPGVLVSVTKLAPDKFEWEFVIGDDYTVASGTRKTLDAAMFSAEASLLSHCFQMEDVRLSLLGYSTPERKLKVVTSSPARRQINFYGSADAILDLEKFGVVVPGMDQNGWHSIVVHSHCFFDDVLAFMYLYEEAAAKGE